MQFYNNKLSIYPVIEYKSKLRSRWKFRDLKH